MQRFSQQVVRLRVPIIIATLLITAFLSWFLKDLRIDADVMSYLPATDRVAVLNREIGKTYGGIQLAIVGLENDDVFSTTSLAALGGLTRALEDLDGIQSVTSLTNALSIRAVEDDVEIGPLIDADNLPRSPEELAELRSYVLGHPMYRGRIVSEDGKATIIACLLREEADKAAVAKQVRATAAAAGWVGSVTFAGLPFQLSEITGIVAHDLAYLVPIAAVLLCVMLFLGFRSVRGTVLPLLSVAISALWTLGVMGLFKVPLSIINNLVPVVLMVTGSAYTIHVVSAYTERDGDDLRDRSARALGAMIVPVALAALTTMAGFLSFIPGSYLTMIRTFGLFCSIGVFFCVLVSVTFVPALLSLLPKPRTERAQADGPARQSGADRALARLGGWVTRHTRAVALGGLALVTACALFIPRITRSSDVLSYFKKNTEISRSEELIRERFGGSNTLQVLVRGDILSPEVLKRMKEVETFLEGIPLLSNTRSVTELIEEMGVALADTRELPSTPEQVANLWFFLEGEEQLSQLIRADGQEAVIVSTVRSMNNRDASGLVKAVQAKIDEMSSEACAFEMSGLAVVNDRLDHSILQSQLWSLVAAVVLILACNLLLVRSWGGALIGLIPIAFTLLVLFGLMGLTGIPLDIITVLIGGISMGMGVDYSIHFLGRYTAERGRGRSRQEAVVATLASVGKPILINVLTIAVGFQALLFGNLVPIQRFGLLISVTMLASGFAAVTLLPAVLLLLPESALRIIGAKGPRPAAIPARKEAQL